MVLPHVISQREDSAPWTTTICQTMHRAAIAPITDHTPTKNARNVRCDITGRPARCWMWCAGSHDLTSPLRTRASHRFHHNLNLSPQRTSPPGCAGVAPAYSDTPHHPCTAWVRGLPARMPGVQALRPHTAIHPITPAPPGCAGVAPASRVHRHCAHIQRYDPSPLHRLGARASRPQAGCTGIAPAYGDTTHHPCTAWMRGLPARKPGAQALRPHTAIHPITPAPPGCAGFQPACRVHRHCARIRRYTPSPLHRLGAQVSRPHAGCTGIAPAYSDTPHHPCTAWVRGLPARMPGAQASCPQAGCAGVAPAHSGATHQRAGRPHPEARVFPQV